MRFDDRFLDEIRARLSVSHVVGRRVPLKKAGREYSGLSPFKQERTASFFVNDAKGFYHCFASGEHGDIFKFLMSTEGLSFPEAVERLAQEAGVPMPQPASPQAQARYVEVQDERERLYAVLAASAQFFRDQLAGTNGAEARGYIARRGLKRDTVATFGLGFAPNGRSVLKEHLAKQGFSVADMVASGMLIGGDDIPVPYDRFRNRVMFPIMDMKGRVIAFGGRALDPNAPAKYLNSPETPLFHKGNVLFNAARARPIAHESQRIVVVEGYMDVVALSEAGFGDCVAPLGTALTPEQIGLLWRFVAEPVLCFDGDKAGQKAAFRAIDTALPHLKPGYSLSFAFLPDGLDPDDLVRQRGPDAMAAILSEPRPLAEMLFERETAGIDLATPERRAKVEQRLRECVRTIVDGNVRGHYERDIRNRWYQLMRAVGSARAGGQAQGGPSKGFPSAGSSWGSGQRSSGGGGSSGRGGGRDAGRGARGAHSGGYNGGTAGGLAAVTSSLKNSGLAMSASVGLPQREALLIRAVINNPWLLDDHAETFSALPLSSEPLARVRSAILSAHTGEKPLDTEEIRHHLQGRGFASTVVAIEQLATHRGDRFAEASSDRDMVAAQWLHTTALHERQAGLRQQLQDAERAWHEDPSAETYEAILELQQRLSVVTGPEE
ncbi:MAG: DNA primase [Hyphomicrobium aestuarii]|nr:DNA primase [Hyphomicrobium aestuarii]